MKKLFLLLGVLCLAPFSLASADMKIAVIDLGKVFDSYYKTKEAQARIKQQQDGFQRDFQDMKADYDHMLEDAQKLHDAAQDPTLSAAARADKSKALQAKYEDVQTMQRKIQETSEERNREIQDEILRRHKEIVDEIAKVVSDYSGPQGFDLVLDKSSSTVSGAPLVLFSSNKMIDITNDIITKLNASAPPQALTVPGGAAPSGAGTGAPAAQ